MVGLLQMNDGAQTGIAAELVLQQAELLAGSRVG
jgi:hypothetical protein